MKKLFLKTVYITLIIGFILTLLFTSLGIFKLDEINMFTHIESNILSFLLILAFFTFLILIFALCMEFPFYILMWFKKINNTVAYKYEDSGTSIFNRELPNYNSAMAGYIVDYTIEAKQDYIALFIELIGKKIIKRDYEGNKLGEDISISTDRIKLKESELFVINTYKTYKNLTIIDFQNFKNIVQKEAIEAGFIKENSSTFDVIDKLHALYSKKFSNPDLALACTGYGLFFAIILLFIFIPIPFNLIAILAMAILFRYKFGISRYTKLGKIEKEKMAKFRKFMKSQTALSQKDINDRNFEKFIPYAIAFDVNNIYQQKIEDMLKNLK